MSPLTTRPICYFFAMSYQISKKWGYNIMALFQNLSLGRIFERVNFKYRIFLGTLFSPFSFHGTAGWVDSEIR